MRMLTRFGATVIAAGLLSSPARAGLFGFGQDETPRYSPMNKFIDMSVGKVATQLHAMRKEAERTGQYGARGWSPLRHEIEEIGIVRPFMNGQAWVMVKTKEGATGGGRLTLEVDGKKKWTFTLPRGKSKTRVYFHWKWLNLSPRVPVEGVISFHYQRPDELVPPALRLYYQGTPRRFSTDQMKPGYALAEEFGYYQVTARIAGSYTAFRGTCPAAPEKVWMSPNAAVWTDALSIAGGWVFNPRAGTGRGAFADPTSPYGSERHRGSIDHRLVRRSSLSASGRGGGPSEVYETKTQVDHSAAKGQWFHDLEVGDPMPEAGHQLDFTAHLTAGTQESLKVAFPRSFSVLLPGRIDAYQEDFEYWDSVTVRPERVP